MSVVMSYIVGFICQQLKVKFKVIKSLKVITRLICSSSGLRRKLTSLYKYGQLCSQQLGSSLSMLPCIQTCTDNGCSTLLLALM